MQRLEEDRFASSDSDGEIKIWSLPNIQNLSTFKAHTSFIWQMTSIEIPNIKKLCLVSASGDMIVKVWQWKSLQDRREFDCVNELKIA